MINQAKNVWKLDWRSAIVGGLVASVLTWVATTSWIATYIARSLSADASPPVIELQTYGLRKAAAYLYANTPVPDRDITKEMIATLAYRHVLDRRLEGAMSELFEDDGFPKEDAQPKLLRKSGGEVRVVGKNGEFYVHFIGVPPTECAGIKYAVCS